MRCHLLALTIAIALVAGSQAGAFPLSSRGGLVSPAAVYQAQAYRNAMLYQAQAQAVASRRAALSASRSQAAFAAALAEAKRRNSAPNHVGPFVGPPNPLSVGNPPVYVPPGPYGKSTYAVPTRLQYLPVGSVIRGPRQPGAAFDLEVVAFQGHKVFIPVTGGGGDD